MGDIQSYGAEDCGDRPDHRLTPAPKIGNPEYFTEIEIRDPVKETEKAVAELRASDKPDVIIAATHMGHYDNGEHGSNAPGDVEMARSLPAGYLDMIVGGHSQDPVCMAREPSAGGLCAGHAVLAGSPERHLDRAGA